MSTRLLPAAEQKTRLVIASKTARYPGFGRGFFTRKRLPRRRFSPACNALPPCMRPPPKPNTAHAACRGPFIKLGGLSAGLGRSFPAEARQMFALMREMPVFMRLSLTLAGRKGQPYSDTATTRSASRAQREQGLPLPCPLPIKARQYG